jgi:hypothetical protein
LGGGKMRHMPDYDFVVSFCLDEGGDEQPGECVREKFIT